MECHLLPDLILKTHSCMIAAEAAPQSIDHFVTDSQEAGEKNAMLLLHIFSPLSQRCTYRVLQTIQMKLILLCVWAEQAVFGSAKTALKFKMRFKQANTHTIQCMGRDISLKSERKNP